MMMIAESTEVSRKILIIEDDQSIREALSEYLEMEGFHTSSVSNGQEAIEYLISGKTLPNLILLDLMMPVKDGFQFRIEQLQIPAIQKIPVLLMSADGNAREKMGTLPVTAYLKKPLELDHLMDAIKRFAQ